MAYKSLICPHFGLFSAETVLCKTVRQLQRESDRSNKVRFIGFHKTVQKAAAAKANKFGKNFRFLHVSFVPFCKSILNLVIWNLKRHRPQEPSRIADFNLPRLKSYRCKKSSGRDATSWASQTSRFPPNPSESKPTLATQQSHVTSPRYHVTSPRPRVTSHHAASHTTAESL